MVRYAALPAAALAGALLVAFPVAGPATARAATNTEVHLAEDLTAAADGSDAVTYDAQAAPVGATLALDVTGADGGATTVSLTARGLLPDRDFVARAHVAPCGPTAAAAGAAFRTAADPTTAARQVELDLHTDAAGDGRGETVVPSSFATAAPRSVVVEEVGTPGGAAACLTLPDA